MHSPQKRPWHSEWREGHATVFCWHWQEESNRLRKLAPGSPCDANRVTITCQSRFAGAVSSSSLSFASATLPSSSCLCVVVEIPYHTIILLASCSLAALQHRSTVAVLMPWHHAAFRTLSRAIPRTVRWAQARQLSEARLVRLGRRGENSYMLL